MRHHLKFYQKQYTIDISNDYNNINELYQNNLRFQTKENKYDKLIMIIGLITIILILTIISYNIYSVYNKKKILPKDKKDIENGLIIEEDDIDNRIIKMGLFDHIIINIIPNGFGIFNRRGKEKVEKSEKMKSERNEDIEYLKKLV